MRQSFVLLLWRVIPHLLGHPAVHFKFVEIIQLHEL